MFNLNVTNRNIMRLIFFNSKVLMMNCSLFFNGLRKSFTSLILLSLFAVLFLTGCGTIRRLNYPIEHTYFPVDSQNYGITRNYPKSFTVYPFMNTSWGENAAFKARQATFEKFSLIGPCANMNQVDSAAQYPYTPTDAIKVARKMGSDAVILGEVLVEDHVWLVMLAYSFVKVKLAIYDTRDGKMLWKGTAWAQSNDWGPLSFSTPIRTIIEHMFWSRITTDLYHRINMDFIHDIRPDVLITK